VLYRNTSYRYFTQRSNASIGETQAPAHPIIYHPVVPILDVLIYYLVIYLYRV